MVRALLPASVLVLAAAFFAYDMAVDLLHGAESAAHLTVEGLVFAATVLALWLELLRIRRLRRRVGELQERLERLVGERYAQIEQQFRRWSLSTSQSEVALLLMKGLSMAEIAQLRGVKDKTVRQQAAEVYAKSGCAGRHELAAYFIDEFMVGEAGPRPPAPG